MSYGEFTGTRRWARARSGRCRRPAAPHEIKVSGLPPVLVVSTTNDPATPYRPASTWPSSSAARSLTFEGTQHTVVFQGNTCVDDIAARYLVDVTVPPAGTRC